MMEKKPIRIQRKRTRGWRLPKNTICVGRGTKWGNPFEVGAKCCVRVYNKRNLQEQYMWLSAEMACLLYKERITNAIEQLGLPDLQEIRGKNLACFCGLDQPCHADVLLELANGE